MTLKKYTFPIAAVTLMLLAGLIRYPELPAEVPSHWNASGQVDDTMPKLQFILFLPLLTLGIALLMEVVPRLDPRKDAYDKFRPSYMRMRDAIVMLMAFIHLIILWQYDNSAIVNRSILFGVSMMLAYLGNELVRFEQTWFTGIRTPWTLADERVWKKTHRFGGRAFVVGGLLGMVTAWIAPLHLATGLFAALVVGIVITTYIYSWWVYQKIAA